MTLLIEQLLNGLANTYDLDLTDSHYRRLSDLEAGVLSRSHLSEENFRRFLAQTLGLKFVPIARPSATDAASEALMRQFGLFVAPNSEGVSQAFVGDLDVLSNWPHVEQTIGQKIQPVISLRDTVKNLILQAQANEQKNRGFRLKGLVTELDQTNDFKAASDLVKLVVDYARADRASVVHFTELPHGLLVHFRIRKILVDFAVLNKNNSQTILSAALTFPGSQTASTESGPTVTVPVTFESGLSTPKIISNRGLGLLLEKTARGGLVICLAPELLTAREACYDLLSVLAGPQFKTVVVDERPLTINPYATYLSVRPSLGLTVETVVRQGITLDPDCLLVGELKSADMLYAATATALLGRTVLVPVVGSTYQDIESYLAGLNIDIAKLKPHISALVFTTKDGLVIDEPPLTLNIK